MTFKAPWGKQMKYMTVAISLLLLGLPLFAFILSPEGTPYGIGIFFPILIFLGTLLFIIRGYTIEGKILFVHRLLWNTKVDLSGLVSVESNPDAMSKAIRTFGNGGLFSISGFFRNKTLGSFRAYATDPQRSVVLKFEKRTIVVTPDRPDVFVTRVESMTIV